MPAVAISDYNNLFASLEFSKEASYSGIQPIVGVTLSLYPQTPNSRGLSGSSADNELSLYAKSAEGYANLLKIVGDGYLRPSRESLPSITLDNVLESSAGLIAITTGRTSFEKHLEANNFEEARRELAVLQEAFADRLYMGVCRQPDTYSAIQEHKKLEIAQSEAIPIVAVNDAYFLEENDFAAHEVFLCIAKGAYINDQDHPRLTKHHRLKSADEMIALFSDLPEAVENTLQIAQRCSFMVQSSAPMLPKFSSDINFDESEEFRRLARAGLQLRLQQAAQLQSPTGAVAVSETDYLERLEFELNVIINMKFAGYFLIVSDFIRWAKSQEIPVGPGRGSGAGSLVAWSLQITDLDPIRFGLLFERFLNPDRVSMPDFDIDFCQDRREEVITYVQQKYGKDRVAAILTFGKLQARAVIRDVGRVLQLPYAQVDRISKLIPVNPANPVDLSQALVIEPLLNKARREDDQVDRLIDIALKLEGLNRHTSTHAAGIVIGERPLQEMVPMYSDGRSAMPIVQYTMKYAEEAGLVKFDFLGLKTLSVIKLAVEMVNRNLPIPLAETQEPTMLDINTIPLNDLKTFEFLATGNAIGVFQLESSGMRDTIKRMKPDTLEDIIALISLYRPGPMENIPTYIARKHGLEKPEYPHPLLENVLNETFGVIIYQEQVMQIAQILAGYTLAEADLLRRAMGKKIKAEMEAQREIFSTKAANQGVDAAKAKEVFDLIAKFASYGFNKSHAAAYALISYQTAYLKANHPVEFLAASMAYDMGNTDKLAAFRNDAVTIGVKILPPDINKSGVSFTVEVLDDGSKIVRYALGAIKGVGENAMQAIVAKRDAAGDYTDIWDFLKRSDSSVANRRQFESLVKSGALDSIHPNRLQLLESIDTIVAFVQHHNEEKENAQASLFGEAGSAGVPLPRLANVRDFDTQEKLSAEFDAIGFYLSSHPLENYLEFLLPLGITWSENFGEKIRASATFQPKPEKGYQSRANNGYVPIKVAGVVVDKKFKTSQKGRFGFVQLSDPFSLFEISIFDDALIDKSRDMFEAGKAVCAEGEAKLDEFGGVKIIVSKISYLHEIIGDALPATTVQVASQSHLRKVSAMLAQTKRGKTSVRLKLSLDQASITLRLPESYFLEPNQLTELAEVRD
jgi:DNA polymerase-3 subunit alpha